jgi:hypothetical protein
MMSEEEQEQASRYALGELAEEELASFQAELAANAELSELTRSLQSIVSQLRETLQNHL